MTGYSIHNKNTLIPRYGLRNLFFCILLLPGSVLAEVISSVDDETGLRGWEWHEQGISFQLRQRLPDQTRAFFLARGFNKAESDSIAQSCIFQSIFRNDGQQPLSYNLNDWQIHYQGRQQALLTRRKWDEKWQEQGVSQAARIAFRWSLLPTRQSFQPGDYNWGMTSFGLPPGESFDLTLTLHSNGKTLSATIPAIECAFAQPSGK
ncbi:MAG: hypothetical protein KZQ58_04315 [gamma proteobacterium symbiont of Bathyaustriella thionipta]|nr:hypothetical protein [gamma proteobacterium symbiont of Bathyaustriella thionipta]